MSFPYSFLAFVCLYGDGDGLLFQLPRYFTYLLQLLNPPIKATA